MYGPFGLGNNVAGIVFILLVVAFLAVVAIGSGFLIYAARELKKCEDTRTNAE